METVLKAIADWIKGILTAGIMSNLSGLFDDVNTQVGNIAQQVGTKPSAFEPRVFAMIEALSRNVVLPIAGVILTFIACYELIEMITQHNNMCWPYPAWEMKLRPLPAEETEGVMYYDPAATGERIQNLRKDREVTQEQLAIDLNISDRYMRNLEKGEKVPSVDLFVELRERFGSSLDYIVLGVSASQREQELQDQLQMLRKELKEMQRRILVMLEMLGESA